MIRRLSNASAWPLVMVLAFGALFSGGVEGFSAKAAAENPSGAFWEAVRSGKENQALQIVHTQGDPDGYLDSGKALCELIRMGKIQIASELLKAGADPNIPGGEERELPLVAAVRSGDEKIIRLLLRHGADPARAEWDGGSAIQAALEQDRQDILDIFRSLGHKPRIDSIDLEERSLCGALGRGDLGAARLLLKKGADINFAGPDGEPPIFSALRNLRSLKFALENGADPNSRNKDQATPLLAVQVGMYRGVYRPSSPGNEYNYVFGPGFSASPKGADPMEPIHEAIRMLLKHGADPNIKSVMGYTPLLGAARMGDLYLIKMLLEKGADPNIKTTEGDSPLGLAAKSHQMEAAALMEKYAAMLRDKKP